MAGKSQVFV